MQKRCHSVARRYLSEELARRLWALLTAAEEGPEEQRTGGVSGDGTFRCVV
jgi:hypothetical protein